MYRLGDCVAAPPRGKRAWCDRPDVGGAEAAAASHWRRGFDVMVVDGNLPAHPTNHRYIQGQRLYLAECDPEGQAGVVIDNTDLARPIVVRTR